MKEMTDNGYPLNRFAELVDAKQVVERAVPEYHEFLDEMEISNNEKQVLRSIVDKGRSGEIDCFVEGSLLGSIKINIVKAPKEITALAVKEGIKKILQRVPKGKKCEFSFTEK